MLKLILLRKMSILAINRTKFYQFLLLIPNKIPSQYSFHNGLIIHWKPKLNGTNPCDMRMICFLLKMSTETAVKLMSLSNEESDRYSKNMFPLRKWKKKCIFPPMAKQHVNQNESEKIKKVKQKHRNARKHYLTKNVHQTYKLINYTWHSRVSLVA